MFNDKTDLKEEVRKMTGYTSDLQLSSDGLDTAYQNAKRHITIKKSIADDLVWFGSDNLAEQDALYWWTCLFTKVQTGELDSQDIQAGAVDQKTLLAKEDGETTMWYRQASNALEQIKSSNIIQSGSPARADRDYEASSFETGDSAGSGGSNEVDSTDL